jgi:CubicO group peptidase (beta-lactamase class C family)/D-alanyl-D-alanine dipeptidase
MLRRFAGLLVLVGLPVAASGQAPDVYGPAIKAVDAFVEQQVKEKKFPSLSIALVDDQKVVWSKGYGFRDRAGKEPATDKTIYRVGSVSKLFTDIAVMQLVEQGKLDLDASVSTYLPDFKPVTKAEHKPITLRMLMSHRSGLIREPPIGNYFDPDEPSLAKTVASLNGIEVVYPPGTKEKYSNAGIGVVGYVLEVTQKEKFETVVQKNVLDKLGMTSSSFLPTATVKQYLSDAVMWTYHGKEFRAPTFELGMAPAGCMYSTVLDLAKFQSALFAGGRGIVKPETLEQMLTPQYAKGDAKRGFGIGFSIGELDGHKQIGHGGAIYGFATNFSALPTEKLGVVVVCSRDVANAIMNRIGDIALGHMLAAKTGKPMPKIETTEPLTRDEAKAFAGRYRDGEYHIDLFASAEKLYFTPGRGGFIFELRKSGKDLVVDDVQGFGTKFVVEGDTLKGPTRTFRKEAQSMTPPAEAPAKWKGLIGEYGWDHNTLYVYEKDGQLHALIEWTEIDPLTEESENVYAFPTDRGMYHGEKLIFTRDATGRATQVEAAKIAFKRRKLDGESGETFRLKATKPIEELRMTALAATPPKENGTFKEPDLVDLATAVPGLKFDIRYATDNNFMSTPFYSSAKAYFQRPAAESLKMAQAKLKPYGVGLIIYDSYRPWHVTKMFWDGTDPKFHNFVADPSKGSRHNRGCAVDLGLFDLQTGKVIEVVAGFDEFSDRSFPNYPGGTSRQRWYRDLLRRAMEDSNFTIYEEEWWHFDFKDWKQYPILNKTFEELAK